MSLSISNGKQNNFLQVTLAIKCCAHFVRSEKQKIPINTSDLMSHTVE